MRARVLTVADSAAARRFLESRPYTTMFLRTNLRDNGLPVPGRPHASTWAGVFDDDGLVGVAAHDGSNRLVPEAPTGLERVVQTLLAASGRPVSAIIGPTDQVVAARTLLGLDDAPTQLDSHERLFALALADLRVPEALATGTVTCRRATAHDMDVLLDWRTAYEAEVVHVTETPAVAAARRDRLARMTGEGRLWILHRGSKPVAMSAFNAALPDCVQVGGVYTPPAERSRGYARCVVAGSLLDARAEGVQRTVLFASSPPAQRAYLALGYEGVGDYGLLVFPPSEQG